MCSRSKNHLLGTHLLVYYTKSTFIVSAIVNQRFLAINNTRHPINDLLPSITLCVCHLIFLFHFLSTLFHGLIGACMNLGSIFSNFLFVHSLVCPITHSFLDGFQPNFVQHFPQVCSTCHTIFSLKKHL